MTAGASEPVAATEHALALLAWRQRTEPPVVEIRCGRGKRRCDRLALIYETPSGPVVVFYQSTPDVRMGLSAEHVEGFRKSLDLAEELGLPSQAVAADVKRWDGDSAPLLRGRVDERGTVMELLGPGWYGDPEPMCRRHVGENALPQKLLLNLLAEARRRPSGRLSYTLEGGD